MKKTIFVLVAMLLMVLIQQTAMAYEDRGPCHLNAGAGAGVGGAIGPGCSADSSSSRSLACYAQGSRGESYRSVGTDQNRTQWQALRQCQRRSRGCVASGCWYN